jgi:hypothetical protein
MSDQVSQQANGNATVGVQVGVVHGNATFYTVRAGATAAERYRVGLNYLNGNVPRKAEQLIHEAVVGGLTGSEVAYHWALAILSGRAFDHLDEADFNKINDAFKMGFTHGRDAQGRRDEWLCALDMVVQLMHCIADHENREHDDFAALGKVLDMYGELPERRRDEIRRHLDMILVGSIEDMIDDQFAGEIQQRRKAGRRTERVPKFFEPPPAKPRLRALARERVDPDDLRRGAWGGVALLAGGALLPLWRLVPGQLLAVLLLAALWGGGGYLILRYGPERLRVLAERRHLADRGTLRRGRGQPWEQLRSLIDTQFAVVRPDGIGEDAWRRDTEPVRDDLLADLTARYSYQRSKFAPWDLKWLIAWHAGHAAARWERHRTAQQQRRVPVVPDAIRWRYGGGVAAVVCGFAVAVVAPVAAALSGDGSPWQAGLAMLVAMVATALFAFGGMKVHESATAYVLDRERTLLDERARDAAFDAETKAWEAKQREGSDAPSDLEMARWLDYDKVYVRNYVMRSVPLRNRDLIGHVTVTEPHPNCSGARVLYGPMRYSVYRVRVFLMTDHGVRQFTVDLDFRTGNIMNERELLFQYGSIAFASAGEVGIQFDDGKASAERSPAGGNKLTFLKALRLTLREGGSIELFVENFDEGFIDRIQVDSAHLGELTRDAAGVDSGIRILKSIAADGADWVRQERIRRNRRLEYFREAQRRKYPQIGAAPGETTLNLRAGIPRQLPPGADEEIIDGEVDDGPAAFHPRQ